MAKTRARSGPKTRELQKVPSGIAGLDAITGGGLPKGRPTLVSGGAGSGKTLFAIQFLIHAQVTLHRPKKDVHMSLPAIIALFGLRLGHEVADFLIGVESFGGQP